MKLVFLLVSAIMIPILCGHVMAGQSSIPESYTVDNGHWVNGKFINNALEIRDRKIAKYKKEAKYWHCAFINVSLAELDDYRFKSEESIKVIDELKKDQKDCGCKP